MFFVHIERENIFPVRIKNFNELESFICFRQLRIGYCATIPENLKFKHKCNIRDTYK